MPGYIYPPTEYTLSECFRLMLDTVMFAVIFLEQIKDGC